MAPPSGTNHGIDVENTSSKTRWELLRDGKIIVPGSESVIRGMAELAGIAGEDVAVPFSSCTPLEHLGESL